MMKSLSFAFALLSASSSAFAPTHNIVRPSSLYMSESAEPITEAAAPLATEETLIEATIATPAVEAALPLPAMSQALPFMTRPVALDGSLAGDVGFDPFGFAKSESDLMNYREAEVKHGRLAMLASVGWVTSEELQGAIARRLGLPDDLAPGELAPSLINGGLGNLPQWFLPLVFLVSAWIELAPGQVANRDELLRYKVAEGERVPGDLKFDPLALRPTLEGMGYPLKRLHNAEVKHGRAAMIAITAFVSQEFLTGVDVLTEDEIEADRLVKGIDQGIDLVDKALNLGIPDVPMPFSF